MTFNFYIQTWHYHKLDMDLYLKVNLMSAQIHQNLTSKALAFIYIFTLHLQINRHIKHILLQVLNLLYVGFNIHWGRVEVWRNNSRTYNFQNVHFLIYYLKLWYTNLKFKILFKPDSECPSITTYRIWINGGFSMSAASFKVF